MNDQSSPSHFLDALSGHNQRVPVWMMRQAGRYLPAYMALKKNHTLNEMFRNPATASRITLMPLDYFDFDALILFADILTLPSALGFDIEYLDKQGPVIANPITSPGRIDQLIDFEHFDYLAETIALIHQQRPVHIPLLGFAGSPFTVATYLIEGGSSLSMSKTFAFAFEHTQKFAQFLDHLTENTIRYLNWQFDQGVQAVQLFDTWAGVLRREEYDQWVLPRVQQIFAALKGPGIYYLKHGAHLADSALQCGADVMSVCDHIDLYNDQRFVSSQFGIQGNLLNTLLYAKPDVIHNEVIRILDNAKQKFPKYIFNLSHGLFPDIPLESVQTVVDAVHNYSWTDSCQSKY